MTTAAGAGSGCIPERPAPAAAPRCVLLGASNLTMGLPLVAAATLAGWRPGPYEILVAAGHGRAYATGSDLLGRSLPPIGDSGLWAALAGAAPAPTRAVLTDLGNDQAYGEPAARVAGAVADCIARLEDAGAEIVITLPPLASIERLGGWRFGLLKRFFFPGRRFDRATILDAVAELRRRLAALPAGARVHRVEPRPEWYGFDRIHIPRRRRAEAWQRMLAPFAAGRPAAPDRATPRPRWRFWRCHRARLFGIPVRNRQPAAILPDGSVVSYF